MELAITLDDLAQHGLDKDTAQLLLEEINAQATIGKTAEQTWSTISQQILAKKYPFEIHLFVFLSLFPNWHQYPYLSPAWIPNIETISSANISAFMTRVDITTVDKFHAWTVKHYEEFWDLIIKQLGIVFKKNYTKICDLSAGVENPRWLIDAKFNIVDSCFQAPEHETAIIYHDDKSNICKLSYAELEKLTNRIANSLIAQDFKPGDSIAIIMPMNFYAIAAYLAIIRMGGVVVSIADSFTTQEIAERLSIAKAKAIFTQDYNLWAGKKLGLYKKIADIKGERPIAIVLSYETNTEAKVSEQDLTWKNFLVENSVFEAHQAQGMEWVNILFSSGTTAQPKAIPWTHATAIKAASDAFFHQNIKSGDVLAWPTNLGWMMGPWLIFAAMINKSAIALYTDAPKDKAFGEFIARAQVTMLGVVPTLVHTWRQTKCMEDLDWSNIKIFSSTGECSNPEDMLYLMSLAGYKPIIEYCGGTEIGGSYVSSTVIENNCPSLFTTPVIGIDFTILDEHGKNANEGEVAIIPPSLGLSTTLLNANHHHVYYADMPVSTQGILRRHGDQIKRFPNGYYMLLGRADDSMNLGGIKVSAAEIERVVLSVPIIEEVAAIGVMPEYQGPTSLVIYAVTHQQLDGQAVKDQMQKEINTQLNPLFKITEVVLVSELPKTASNKIMRRKLREEYLKNKSIKQV